MKKFSFLLLAIFLYSCTGNSPAPVVNTPPSNAEDFVPTIDYTLVSRLPHDTLSFTEGLLFSNGKMFESTGSPENLPALKSVLGIVDTLTGKINVKAELEHPKYFGEGIVILNNKIYQLTYKNQIGFVYDLKTFKQLSRFSFESKEGWGMTTDGKVLIMSDGTNVLTCIDPATLKKVSTISVSNGGYAEDYLNELEYINGYIYANVWTKNYVVKIDPSTGKVVGLIDFAALTDEAHRLQPQSEVLNGIAYDSVTDRIYVTGKLWRNIYCVNFAH